VTPDDQKALATARYLAECGVPIRVARPSTKHKIGYHLPEGWERSEADPDEIDKWQPGWAIFAVMGHTVDAIDVDPRNGGDIEALREALGGDLPKIYGVQNTPSGGQHYLVAPLGVRKVQSIVPGVDIQAGNADGVGRGFIFIAPMVRTDKRNGDPAGYSWELEPDLDELLLIGTDDTGAGLTELVETYHNRSRGSVDSHGSYDGPTYSELTDGEREESDGLVESQTKSWAKLLEKATDWPEGKRDERGRGWEKLATDCAWALAKMAACPWMGIDEVGAALTYHEILPAEFYDDDACSGKWYDGIVEKAAGDPVDIPPWVIRGDVADDFGRPKPVCDVTSPADAARWLDEEIGCRRLAGMFRRKDDLIYTPRIGEEGYDPPEGKDEDGPAQIRRMSPLQLAKRVDKSYHVIRRQGKNKSVIKEEVFPDQVAQRSMSLVDELPNLKNLRMVTHTPVIRADGTVLDAPGFDDASGVLYLPERGLYVEPVPREPTAVELKAAVELVLEIYEDFPFVSAHDQANYLGCLFIPLIRSLVPPPYKMLIIGAPQRGSGKSLLAELMRIIHGGVFRSEIPHDEEERRKVITSILDSTSAPVVQFDNVSGVLRSSTMDGLLTSAVWGDRRLGVNVNVELPNDRLWIATGNNVHIGGDLERRVLWCTINARMEKPELRPAESFHIQHIDQWVREHRGEVIHALLVMVRSWAAAGMQKEKDPTSDSFGPLVAVLRGIMAHAGIEGQLGHQSSAPVHVDPDAEEHQEFIHAVERAFGTDEWTVRELLDKVSDFDDDHGLRSDELPGDVSSMLRIKPGSAVKSLGRWLGYRKDRVVDGRVIQSRGDGKSALKWHLEVTGGTETS
jgi:hypothetical protein